MIPTGDGWALVDLFTLYGSVGQEDPNGSKDAASAAMLWEDDGHEHNATTSMA
ncbi:MAG: hypothetical protein ACPGOY_12845 [Rhodospirillaceae bacterium]